jgi:hypothetical protein
MPAFPNAMGLPVRQVTGIVWDARGLAPDELSEEGEFEDVGQDVGWTRSLCAARGGT